MPCSWQFSCFGVSVIAPALWYPNWSQHGTYGWPDGGRSIVMGEKVVYDLLL